MSHEEIMNIAEVRLVYTTKIKPADRPQIKDSGSAFEIFWKVWDHDRIEHTEAFKVLFMNRANRVLGVMPVSEGGISGTVMDARVILQGALRANASAMILCHNHPSGNLQLSSADQTVTDKLKTAGTYLDIKLLDHLIITPDRKYFSMADEGLI